MGGDDDECGSGLLGVTSNKLVVLEQPKRRSISPDAAPLGECLHVACNKNGDHAHYYNKMPANRSREWLYTFIPQTINLQSRD